MQPVSTSSTVGGLNHDLNNGMGSSENHGIIGSSGPAMDREIASPDLYNEVVSLKWNSTYLMLERAMKFRAAFERMDECDSAYKFLPSDDGWKHIKSVTDCLKSKSELEIYLEDPCCPGIGDSSFDILTWWKTSGPKYPIISRMARDILSVPLTTVASESAFSSAKRILDDYHCNLLPQTVEAIMCSHGWLKGRVLVESRPLEESTAITNSSLPSQEHLNIDD